LANGDGLFEISGGTATFANWFILGRTTTSSSTQFGVANISGGTLVTPATGTWIGFSSTTGATSILNMTGGTINGTTNSTNLQFNTNAYINLNGGTIQVHQVTNSSAGRFNFNGGTLKAYDANASFYNNAGSAYVWPGGAIIDDNGVAITITQVLATPAGSSGVVVGTPPTVTGLISPPIVRVTGTGTGACAVATINGSGALTGVTVTNPGINYTGTPTFTLSGGGMSSSQSFSGTVTANTGGGLTKQGSSTLTLSGTNTYDGNTTVSSGGTLKLGSATVIPDGAGKGDVSLAGTIDLAGFSETINGLSGAGTVTTSTGTPTFTVGSNDVTSTFGGTIVNGSGTVALTKTGAGTLSLTNNSNAYTGTTTISAGTLSIGAGSTTGAISNSSSVTDNATLIFNRTNTYSYTGAITGTGAVTQSGAGTTNLSNTSNAWAGTTTISAGTLQLGASNVLPDGSGKGDVSLAGTLDLNNFSEGINGLSGAGTVTNSNNSASTLTVGNNNVSSTFGGAIVNGSGTIALTKSGSGTLSLTGANTFTGTATINSGGTLAIGTGATSGSLAANVTNNGTLVFNRSDASSYGGAVSGSGVVTQNGAGALTLSGNNSHSGGTNLSNGTLNINSTTALGATASAFTIAAGVTIDNTTSASITLANNNPQTWNGNFTFTGTQGLVMGTGAVTLGATPTITVSANTLTEGGVISGSSYGIVKAGGGTLTLSGQNTYGGGTTVSTGTLFVTNSAGSATGTGGVTVNGGTLGGTGIISGTVAINSTATLSPGTTGTGTLTIGNNLTFASGSTLAITLNGATAGSGYDQVNQTGGTVSLGGNAVLSLTLSYSPAEGQAYTIISVPGTSTPATGKFNGLNEGDTINATYNNDVYSFAVSYAGGDGNDVTLTACNENYAAWQYSQRVFLNTTVFSGAQVTTDQTNFPVLIRLDTTNFRNFSQTLPGGADIRFAGSDGTHLSYEIERWQDNAANVDTGVIWVKVPTVYGNNGTQYIRMYWGNKSVTTKSNGAAVFSPSNSWFGVWHLDSSTSAGDGSTTPYLDATGQHNGADYVAATGTTGLIASGQQFTGASTDYISAGTADPSTTNLTLSAWVYRTGHNAAYQTIVAKRDLYSTGNNRWQWYSNKDASDSMAVYTQSGGVLNYIRRLPQANGAI
jgi:fibronectin-binding autotransporter adhesin